MAIYQISPQLLRPLHGGPVSQYFGENRVGPGAYARFGITSDQHNGIDYYSLALDPVLIYASHPGAVETNSDPAGYGNWVRITHSIHSTYTYTTIYAHLASTLVAPGSYIEAGTPIGHMGSTGMSTGRHLHWGLKFIGPGCTNPAYLNWVNPYPFRAWEY